MFHVLQTTDASVVGGVLGSKEAFQGIFSVNEHDGKVQFNLIQTMSYDIPSPHNNGE